MQTKTILMAALSLCGSLTAIAERYSYSVSSPGGISDSMPGNILNWKVYKTVYDDDGGGAVTSPYTNCTSTVYRNGIAIATVQGTSYRDLDVLAGSTNTYFITAMGATSPECKKVCGLSYTMTTRPVTKMTFSADGGTQTTTISGTQLQWSRQTGLTSSSLSWGARSVDMGWLTVIKSGDDLAVTAKKMTGITSRQSIIRVTLNAYLIAQIHVTQGDMTENTDVVITTDAGEIIVPSAWFDAYPDLASEHGSNEDAATSTAANGMKVWECYVAGLDPTNENSHFEAKIEMKEGMPVVTWSPNLNEKEETRVYTIYGKGSFDDGEDWTSPTNSLHRFFKVGVQMP